jgi:putative tricarboxylic transport membrane protein
MRQEALWKKLNNRELWGSAVILVSFGIIKVLSIRLPAKVSAYPIVMSNVALVLSVILFVRSLYRLKKGTLQPEKMSKEDGKAESRMRTLLTIVLLIGYALAFGYLGVILSTLLFVFLFTRLFGEKKNLKVEIIIAVGVTAVIYLVFSVFLGISLPTLFLQGGV